MLRWLGELTNGKLPKRAVLIYIDQDDLLVIEEAKRTYKVESRGQYVRNAIRHYKDVLEAIYGTETEIKNQRIRKITERMEK